MKLRKSLLLTAMVVAGCSFNRPCRAADDDAATMAAIARVGEAFIEAFEKGDAKAVAAFWLKRIPLEQMQKP